MVKPSELALETKYSRMHPNTDHHEGWAECPEGTLQAVATRSRRRRVVRRAALTIPLAVALLLAMSWGGYLPLPMDAGSAPLRCDQVKKLLPAYASNSLSASRRARVELHLKKCPSCWKKLKAIEASQSIAASIGDARKGDAGKGDVTYLRSLAPVRHSPPTIFAVNLEEPKPGHTHRF